MILSQQEESQQPVTRALDASLVITPTDFALPVILDQVSLTEPAQPARQTSTQTEPPAASLAQPTALSATTPTDCAPSVQLALNQPP